MTIGQPNTIEVSEGKCSKIGACPDPHTSLLGKTNKSDTEIAEFNKAYLGEHPTYNMITDNCQTYVTKFFDFLMEDGEPDSVNKLPPHQSPFSGELEEEEEGADHLPSLVSSNSFKNTKELLTHTPETENSSSHDFIQNQGYICGIARFCWKGQKII